MAIIAFDPEVPVHDRHAKSFPKHPVGEPAVYGPFSEACSTRFEWDAHFSAYQAPGIARRLGTQAALAHRPKMVLFVVDVDGPDHAASDEWWAGEKAKVQALFRARGRGYVYRTRGGYRIAYGLRDELALDSPEAALRWRHSYLEWLGVLLRDHQIAGDPACADWTRCYRLPRVRRDGADVEPLDEVGEAGRMLEWREPYLAPDDPRLLRSEQPIDVPEPAPVDEADLKAAVLELAAAWPRAGRHRASLALCGALARLGWSDEAIADFAHAVCYFAAELGGPPLGPEAGFEKRLAQARSSAEKVARGEDVAGWGSLEEFLGEGAPRERLVAARRALGCGPAIDLFERVRSPAPAASATDAASVRALLAAAPGGSGVDPIERAAFESEMAAERAAASPDFAALLDDVATHLPPMIEEAESKSKTVDARPMGMTYREMRARNLPPPEYLIEGLIPREGVGALSGEPKAGKSWDATYYAVCVATGRPAFGRLAVQRPSRVFYYYHEDGESSVNNRVGAIAAELGVDPEGPWLDNLVIQPRGRPIDVLNTAQLCVLAASVRRFGGEFALVVLDPLSNIHSGEEDKRDSMVKVMARLHALEAYLKVALVFVHHAGKDSADNKGRKRGGQKMRGSSAIHGSIDFGIYFGTLRGDGKNEYVARVESEMKALRGAGVFDRRLVITDNERGNAVKAAFSWAEPEQGAPQDLTEQRAHAVVAKLWAQQGPLTFDELKKKIGGKTDIVHGAIGVAMTEGWVAQKYSGGKASGYEITEKGRALIRDGGGDPEPEPEGGPAPGGHPAARFGNAGFASA